MREKETYEAPRVEVLEVRNEGIICASGDPKPYNNPFGDQQNW